MHINKFIREYRLKKYCKRNPAETEEFIFKTVESLKLKLIVYLPKEAKGKSNYPAVVFFGGGGWKKQSTDQFKAQCHYLAGRGIVCIAAEYRTQEQGKAAPLDGLEDAKDAIAWVRENAEKLSVNPEKIAAGGGSAGGYLAAGCALLKSEKDSNKSSIYKPNALVLLNPVLDILDENLSEDLVRRINTMYEDFAKKENSLYYNVDKGTVPTLIIHGTYDTVVPFEQAKKFAGKMFEYGNVCELISADKQDHGFFNFFKSYMNDKRFWYDFCSEKIRDFILKIS